MKSTITIAALLSVAVLLPQAVFAEEATETPAEKMNLSKAFQMTNGDIVAKVIEDTIKLTGRWDSPTFVTVFMRDKNAVTVFWRGEQNTAESAKEIMEELRKIINNGGAKMLKDLYGLELPADEFVIVYGNKRTNKNVLAFAKGQYMLP